VVGVDSTTARRDERVGLDVRRQVRGSFDELCGVAIEHRPEGVVDLLDRATHRTDQPSLDDVLYRGSGGSAGVVAHHRLD
jgi:hypothetical protein